MRVKPSTRLVVIAVALATFAGHANAAIQDSNAAPVRYTLTTIETLPGEFTSITGVRELSDGTLLVADRVEGVIKALRQATDPIVTGRVGQGPGEWYRSPDGLFAFFADSTVVHDRSGARVLFMTDLEITQHMEGGSPAFSPTLMTLIGVDTIGTGHWALSKSQGMTRQALPGGASRNESSDAIVRLSRDMSSADTLRIIAGSVTRSRALSPVGGRRVIGLAPLRPSDEALGFADGWIAVAMHEPYRVDWLPPDGNWIRGPTLRVEAGSEDADTLYAFGYGSVSPLTRAPDGRLLVRRNMPDESPTFRYDVIDRSGRLNGYFMVDANVIVLGSGREALYVSTEDDFGLLRVSKVAWPPTAEGEL